MIAAGSDNKKKKMKRSHTYSSSESDLDDNVDVEKDSGDENGYVTLGNNLIELRVYLPVLF